MKRFNAGRYVAVETAISAAVNVVLGVVPTIVSADGQETSSALGAPGLDLGTVLPLFTAAFMSALVPSLLTRRRQLGGKFGPKAVRGGPTMIQVVSTCLALASSFTALGMLLAEMLPPMVDGMSPAPGATLLLKGAYGGLLAALVTPSALFLLFGRSWRERNEQDKRAGDRPGTVADRLLGGRL